jgi:hypothetical protein
MPLFGKRNKCFFWGKRGRQVVFRTPPRHKLSVLAWSQKCAIAYFFAAGGLSASQASSTTRHVLLSDLSMFYKDILFGASHRPALSGHA